MFGIPTRRVRIVVQAAVFALWVALILATHHPMDAWILKYLPASLFLRMDPLVTTVVSGGLRIGVTITFLGFVTLAISLLLGRVFCGWVCPLGTIFDAYGWVLKRFRIRIDGPSPSWFRFKYYLLSIILIFALIGGVSPLMGFDPIVLLTRTAAAVLNPLLRTSDQVVWQAGVAPGNYGYFVDTLTLLLFLGIMTGTTKLTRIWCRTACPLGAYLGVIARHSTLRRDTSGCVHCNICSSNCPTGAINYQNAEEYNESECIKCFSCSQECPVDANFFTFKNPTAAFTTTYAPVELDRRNFLVSATAAVVAAPIFHLSAGEPGSYKTLLRPPLSREEKDFLTSCIRCDECVKACPTGILKPATFEHGLRALWSPVMVPTEGYCKEGCNACSQACPTDAILKYPIEKKYTYKAGTAIFDSSRCISFTENKYCVECVKVCPTDAIEIDVGWVPESGSSSDTPAPAGKVPSRPKIVSYDRCIGCGHCEFVCDKIVSVKPAMVTTSFGRGVPSQLNKV
jgi:ferredoxin